MKNLTETEEHLLCVLCGFEFTAAEKLKVLESYKKVIQPMAYNHIFKTIIFTEELRAAFIEK